MALAAEDIHISIEEYIQGEEISEIRHEYIAGNVYAMSGGTMGHQRVARNFIRHDGEQLQGKTREPSNSDFKDSVLHLPEAEFSIPLSELYRDVSLA